MLYHALLLVSTLTVFFSFFLVYKVTVLEDDISKLRGDISNLKPHSNESTDGMRTGMSRTWERSKQATSLNSQRQTEKDSQTLCSSTASSLRMKPESAGCSGVVQQSFLQLSANTKEQPFVRGNVTVIPWTVALHQGEAISSTGDRIIIQQEGLFIVFGQVLFQSPGTIMGHIVRSRRTGQRSTELLRCLQEMPQTNCANTCYTGGMVKLEREDELELVIPDRPQAQVSMDADSTFFGIIRLN
ncbi:tumor necrosis factor ligand superfamily member 13B-like isoform X2 [Salvelinus fontinalis]|uniref:tumor necrosis factor ligand superfamily member 13B-like isoform X2 n=1 Tax=Salvelinus fontinalis TaxID=8038 RepID=UPI0024857E95|nr:tumor necrosis factor ligand superfamily member 13B-like isoform X2 [Salvelinus fontinalis]